MSLEAHYLIIVARFFETKQDFINFIYLNKKCQQIPLMFKFNPIGDISLFPNIQTQVFYSIDDFNNILPKMFRYKYRGILNKDLMAVDISAMVILTIIIYWLFIFNIAWIYVSISEIINY